MLNFTTISFLNLKPANLLVPQQPPQQLQHSPPQIQNTFMNDFLFSPLNTPYLNPAPDRAVIVDVNKREMLSHAAQRRDMMMLKMKQPRTMNMYEDAPRLRDAPLVAKIWSAEVNRNNEVKEEVAPNGTATATATDRREDQNKAQEEHTGIDDSEMAPTDAWKTIRFQGDDINKNM